MTVPRRTPFYTLLISLLLHTTLAIPLLLSHSHSLSLPQNLTSPSSCYSKTPTHPLAEPTLPDCRILILRILTDPSALLPRHWTGIPSGIIKHWTHGTCHIDLQPTSTRSEDEFALVDVADVAVELVEECVEGVGGRLGGLGKVGGRGGFLVSVQFNYLG